MAIPKSAKFKYEIIQDYKVPNGKAGRFSAGKPTEVVVHSSGNPNAGLESEIAYMAKNQDNAFTHAWSGHNKIVEIANTDYPAWGAGRTANKYAVQIEVTEDKRLTKAQKLQAIDREAFWVAVQCAYYGIPLNKVYSHADISRMYPQDTNHTDPIAFFKSVGISWSAFKEQVKKYYDVLVAGGDTTKVNALGTTSATTATTSSTNTPSVPKGKELQKYEGHPKNENWKVMKVGDKVTIRKGAKRWVNASFKQMEPMQKDYKGATDTVAKVAEVKIGYSDKAYYLKRMKVWLLEQDLVEPRQEIYTVQTGAYADVNNAKKQAEKLKKEGYDTFVTKK
ncbi:N-acetylmuramoyl-L-alanine amidase [Aerococcus urinaeequi]|uniref:N-acetylmuramoyl-L-alanine amidase n=1 Tax=Aerococcus urinaeequi TaxID=51665 RepID=UPI003D6BD8B5